MPQVELKQLVGQFRDQRTGAVKRAGWDIDCLILNGREIAKVKPAPGAPICLYPSVLLTPSDKEAVAQAVAAKRGGVRPSEIREPIKLPFELLDDEEPETDEAETEVDDE